MIEGPDGWWCQDYKISSLLVLTWSIPIDDYYLLIVDAAAVTSLNNAHEKSFFMTRDYVSSTIRKWLWTRSVVITELGRVLRILDLSYWFWFCHH